MKHLKKMLAIVMALCLAIGLLPASVGSGTVEAAGETTYVLAGSDFQPTDASNTTGVNLLNDILDKVKEDYATFDGFIFAGDYDYNYNSSQSGKEALQSAVQSVYGTGMDEIYVQGNHDADSLVGSVLTSSGANDTDNYGVFVINEKDYMWYNDDETTIKNTAASLETYLNAKRNAGYTKPIFVVSHLPLHYCMRTQVGGGDGKHANYIFDVLNEAGAAGLNIIFMFGHNHSHGWDDPYGGAAIFMTKGDSINIAQNSTTDYDVKTLNFTYMNAGYVSYYRNVNTGAETDLSMTTFAITDNDVTISRYTAEGLHYLESAGVANTHASTGSSVDGSCSTNHGGNETYSPDTSTTASAFKLTLNTEITPAGDEVAAPDTGSGTERTYTRVTSTSELVSGGQYLIIENGDTDYFMLPESISNSAGDRVGYNIESTTVAGGDTITGDYSAKEWTMTGSGTSWVLSTSAGSAYMEYQDSSRAYGRISSTNSSTFTIGGSADAFTFSTTTNGYTYVFDHSSAGLINGYVKDPSTTFYIYRLTDEGTGTPTVDTTGGDWVTITEPTEAGTKYVYELDTDGVDTGVEYLIVANSYPKALSAAASSNNAVDVEISGNYAYANSDTYGWTFTTGYNNGYYIRLNGNTYLSSGDGTLTSQNYSTWSVSNNNDGSYDITSGWRTTYNLRWSNSNGVFQASSSNEGPVRLYKYVKTETTEATAGLYGKISGELTYNVAVGTSAEDAVAAVKAGIDILYHTGDESAAKTYPDDGDGMTWTIDSSYDGVTPGEYAVTIAYNGVTLGVAKVVVPSVAIKNYTVSPTSSTVRQGAGQTINTGSKITVTLENGDYYTVPVTISMLSKDGEAVSTATAGAQTGLTVTYNGVVVTNDYTLNVVEKTTNNYPEYPDEGAVKVNKTATGIDFQSSGIAQVELSTSGVPAQKGADVVIVIDTSSSMDSDIDGNTPSSGEKSRIDILSEALEDMLLEFQQPDDSGIYPDIDLAIIDFNGYADTINGASLNNTYRDNADLAEVYTGTAGYIREVGLYVNNFVDNLSIDAAEMAGKFTEDRTSSGTNYDSGLDNAYKLLEMKKEANGDEDRDQYVIFLSDGAPFRYNGYENGPSTGYDNWDKWLRGYWANQDALVAEIPSTNTINAYPYFYNGNGTNHPHRIAEAIKGTEGATYNVVVNTATDADTKYIQTYSGLGAKIYSIGFGLAEDGDGVGTTKGSVVVSTMQNVLKTISSGDGYFYDVDEADELTTAFTQIATAINYAATNARYVDQMGDNFNLQMAPVEYTTLKLDEEGKPVDEDNDGNNDVETKTVAPVIEILTYDIYTRQDYLNGIITEDKIGDRKGTSTLNEVVKFSDDGTKAYSNLIDVDQDGVYGVTVNPDGTYTMSDTDDNIIGTDGIIYAKTFLYNTTPSGVAVDDVDIPTGEKSDGTTTGSTNVLPSETFYWKLGTVATTELAMRYYVYLEGSMEGTKEAGSYATNEYATLYYDNYLGNPCYKDTVSPTIAWKSANVSYAFYLVDENGNIIVNQTTGQTGSFANKIAITNPVVYKEILLNNDDTVEALNVKAISEDVLPKYYELYDEGAVYEVTINSNATGSWEITKGAEEKVNSTYVTQYKTDDASAYSNALTNNTVGDDYTHTIVWFAVVWSVQAHPDVVVVDYGLPVDISVLGNDMFGDYGKLTGIGKYTDGLENTTAGTSMQSGFGDSYTGTYGNAAADKTTGKVRYTLDSMQMKTYEKFAYAVNYSGTENAGYYYDTVTVIPATTIYYEDDFMTYDSYTWDTANNEWTKKDTSLWSVAGETIDGIQDEDRPGKYSLMDANNIYGYDSVNLKMSTYSMGSAMKATVDYDNKAEASFEFYGTGFDVISMTNTNTGTIYVEVYNEAGTKEKGFMVDTYYGYKTESGDADGDGTIEDEEVVWVVDPTVTDSIYQVPVMKVENLSYGKHRVVISAVYEPIYENVEGSTSYDFYLDAIRIYDPANDGAADGTTDTTIENAYKADGEGWPSYIELRNKLISAATLGNTATNTTITGLVFIDGDEEVGDAQIADYKSYGPNNEVYLAPGQKVAFLLTDVTSTETGESIVDSVHIGIKSADGNVGTYTITNIAQAGMDNNVSAGTYYGAKTSTIDTTTDMYYDLSDWKNDIIVISNTGNRYGTTGVISITGIKSTYTENPNGVSVASDDEYGVSAASVEGEELYGTSVYMTPAAATLTLRSINSVATEETPDDTEVVEPEDTEEVAPEEPEVETPDAEIPEDESTESGDTETETTQPEGSVTEVVKEIVNTVTNAFKKMFSWFTSWKGGE